MAQIGIGALIDTAWEDYRKHFANNIRITAWLGVFVLLHIIAISFYPIGAEEIDRALSGSEWFGVGLFLINTLIILPIISIWMVNALIARIDADARGKALSMHKLATESWRLFLPQLWVRILVGVAFVVAFAIPFALLWLTSQVLSGTLPFLVSLLFMFVALLLFLIPLVLMVYLAFVFFALVLDKKHGVLALKESMARVKQGVWGVAWRLIVPKLLYFGVLLVVQYVLLMILGMLVSAMASGGDALLAVRLDWILQPTLYVLLTILVYPIVFITDYRIYRSFPTT